MGLRSSGYYKAIPVTIVMKKEGSFISFYANYPGYYFIWNNKTSHPNNTLLKRVLINDFLEGLCSIGALTKRSPFNKKISFKACIGDSYTFVEKSLRRSTEIFIYVVEASVYFDVADIILFLVETGVFQPNDKERKIPENKVYCLDANADIDHRTCFLKPNLNLERA